MGSKPAQADGAIFHEYVLEAAQVGDVDKGGGGLDAALKLHHHVGAARHDSCLRAVLVEQAQGLFKRRWLKVVLPHDSYYVLLTAYLVNGRTISNHKGTKGIKVLWLCVSRCY